MANSVDPDQMSQNVTSDQGLHILLRSDCQVWVNMVFLNTVVMETNKAVMEYGLQCWLKVSA